MAANHRGALALGIEQPPADRLHCLFAPPEIRRRQRSVKRSQSRHHNCFVSGFCFFSSLCQEAKRPSRSLRAGSSTATRLAVIAETAFGCSVAPLITASTTAEPKPIPKNAANASESG